MVAVSKEQVKKYPRPDLSRLATLDRDDGSTDGTVEIIQELVVQDRAAFALSTKELLKISGLSGFHTLLKYEKADLYCFSDQDDV